jgi:thioesterase domain-containing protein
VDVPLAEFVTSPTVEGVAMVIRGSDMPLTALSPLVQLTEQLSGSPLFVVHPAGGTALCYYDLAERLRPSVGVYGLQHPALWDAEAEVDTPIEDLAKQYIDAVRFVQPGGPYRLAGWSFGGLVAFEMGVRLQRQGETVEMVAILDAVVPKHAPPPDRSDDVFGVMFRLAKAWGLSIEEENLRSLGEDGAIAHVSGLAHRTGLLAPHLGQTYVQRAYDLGKAANSTALQYSPGLYDGRLTLIRVPPRDDRESLPVDYGWSSHSSEPVNVTFVAGEHETLVQPPHVVGVVAALRRALNLSADSSHNSSMTE